MSLTARSIGSEKHMKKRIPKNAKYQHVKTRLDTGCSLTKYLEKLEEIKKNYRFKKDEIFKRLKVSTFAQLILQVTYVSDLNESDEEDSHGPEDRTSLVPDGDQERLSEDNSAPPASLPSGCRDAGDATEMCHSARSTLLSVISGMGELNLNGTNQSKESVGSLSSAEQPYPDCPYLLLDVRDQDQYDLCHIISAHSFPIGRLSRTVNPYSKEILEYKNVAGKLIIVYDEDERIAIQAATIMCERGVENLFMLSGGLKVVAQKFPQGLTTGSFPASCLSSPTPSKPKASSVPPQPSHAAEKRWRFTPDELAKISEQLDMGDGLDSRLSSRMSTSSSYSKASSARSQQSSSSARSARGQSRTPWK